MKLGNLGDFFLQALVSHQYRAPAKGGGKRVIRLSEADAKYLDAIIIHQPLLRERWPSLTGQMQYLPNWPRGRPLKLSSLASRGATPSGDRFVLMAGEQGRDFATGLEACKSAGLAVRLVTGIFDAESLPCSLADSCTLTKFMKYSDYMVLLDKAWAVVVPLLLSRRLSSGAKMVGEAMAAGIPVVVSGHPSSDPWLGVVTHEQNGLIVPPGDQKELTAALLRLKNEPGLHARLRARALKEAEMYSLEAVGERMQVQATIRHCAWCRSISSQYLVDPQARSTQDQ